MKLNIVSFLFVFFVLISALGARWEDFLKPSDPCEDAKAGANKANDFARDSVFTKVKQHLQLLAMDGKEHGVAFGRDATGNLVTSVISMGDANSATLGSVPNKFADLHNHPRNFPPSSGDIYALIDNASLNNGFETRYILTPGGTVYALVITNLQQAKAFNAKYPRVSDKGYQPKFPEVIVEEIIDLKGIHNISEEMAMAYVLKHYQMGITLLKQDGNGHFIILNMDMAKNADGTFKKNLSSKPSSLIPDKL